MNNSKGRKIDQHMKYASEGDATILSDILPLREPRFHGRIGNTYTDSNASAS